MDFVGLSIVVDAIADMGRQLALRYLSRSQAIQQVLRKLNLEGLIDPSDFDAVYVRTLVEFGIDRPAEVNTIFQEKFVVEGFRRSFYTNDSSVFRREVFDLADRLAETKASFLGRDDLARYVDSFDHVFREVIHRLRSPADAETYGVATLALADIRSVSVQLTKLMQSISEQHVQEQTMTSDGIAGYREYRSRYPVQVHSNAAEQVAHTKPAIWEHRLTMEALRSGLIGVHRNYDDLRRGGVVYRKVHLRKLDQIVDWLRSSLDDLAATVTAMNILINHDLDESWGPPGEPGEVDSIYGVTQAIMDICMKWWELECEFAFTDMPEQLGEITSILRWCTEPFIRNIEMIPENLASALAQVDSGVALEPVQCVFTLNFDAPPGIDRIALILEEWATAGRMS